MFKICSFWILEHWKEPWSTLDKNFLKRKKITEIIGKGRMLSLRSQGGGPPAHQGAWKKEWGNFRKRTWHTWKSLALSGWEGSVITWRGGNGGGDVRREIQKGGDTCTPMVHSCRCTTETNQYCQAIINQLNINKQKNQLHFGDRATCPGGWRELAADSRLSVRRGMANLTDLLCRLVFSSQSRLTAPLVFLASGHGS